MGILVLGGTSRIALEIARDYASQGESVFVAARDADEADRIASDLHVRYKVNVGSADFDATDYTEHSGLIALAAEALGGIDVGIVAFGDMGNQMDSEKNFQEALKVMEVNYVGAASICESLAAYMSIRGHGSIVGISSVAGDRGRASNYFYGSAKGGFSTYLEGLRCRLHGFGIHVMTVKLGLVDTPMTYGMKTRIPIVSPQSVARAVTRAQRSRKNTFYYPSFWRFVMFVVKVLPQGLFIRMKL